MKTSFKSDLKLDDVLQKELNKTLKVLKDKICDLYKLDLDLTLSLDLKGTRIIGQCKKLSQNGFLIRLHKPLLSYYKDVYIKDVLYHEISHAVQMSLYKNKLKPHGKEWQKILECLHEIPYKNIKDPNYEKINLLSIKRNYEMFIYTCECPILHKLTSIRASRIDRGYIYICKYCKSKLVKK